MSDYLPLAPRARLLFHLQALARLLLVQLPVVGLATFAGIAFWSLFGALIAGGVLALLLFLLAVWMPSLAFDRWGYQVRDEELLIRRGVLLRSITAIPTQRIQHVDTRQGPLEQWFGLARVQIHTASGVGGDGVIPGLELETAQALRDRLVSLSEGDDGV